MAEASPHGGLGTATYIVEVCEFLSGRWWWSLAVVAEICVAVVAPGSMVAVAGVVVAASVEIHIVQWWWQAAVAVAVAVYMVQQCW